MQLNTRAAAVGVALRVRFTVWSPLRNCANNVYAGTPSTQPATGFAAGVWAVGRDGLSAWPGLWLAPAARSGVDFAERRRARRARGGRGGWAMGMRIKGECTVWVAGTHPLALRYLARHLQRVRGLRIVGAPPAQEAAGSADKPSLLVIDVGSGFERGAALLRRARLEHPRLPAMAIGPPASSDEICRLLFLGFQGLVSYQRVDEEIRPAVAHLLGGHLWAGREVLERYVNLSSASSGPKGRKAANLTQRESLVAGLLQRRLSNKEIASALVLSCASSRNNVWEL